MSIVLVLPYENRKVERQPAGLDGHPIGGGSLCNRPRSGLCGLRPSNPKAAFVAAGSLEGIGDWSGLVLGPQ